MRAGIRPKNAQAAVEPWKTVIAVVAGLATAFTAIGYLRGYLTGLHHG